MAEIQAMIPEVQGKDSYVSPTDWNAMRSYYIKAGGSGKDFDEEYGYLINPTHYWNQKDGIWKDVKYQTTYVPDRP